VTPSDDPAAQPHTSAQAQPEKATRINVTIELNDQPKNCSERRTDMPPIKGDDGASGIPIPFPGTYGALGDSASSYGVVGTSAGRAGVYGASSMTTPDPFQPGGSGVLGVNETAKGVGVGVAGAGGWAGVNAFSFDGTGLLATSINGNAVWARSGQFGTSAFLASGWGSASLFGDVLILGTLRKSGGGFIIDHPLDPANKYLHHSFVESPERKNVYDGIAVLDDKGEALVELPEWCGALNRDFRYQLTCLGGYAPVFVVKGNEEHRFRIAGGRAGLEVCWQVTGVRQDPWAKANPVNPEEEKPKSERGSFLVPALYGAPEEKSLQRARFPEPAKLPKGPRAEGTR
jgi:hypothetical protein